MKYRIAFLRWDQSPVVEEWEAPLWEECGEIPRDVSITGPAVQAALDNYNPDDYYDEGIPDDFPSVAEALEWGRLHHKGPDIYGVIAVFEVEPFDPA